LAFEYFKFISWTALWAWTLSDTAARFIIPLTDRFYDSLDMIAKTGLKEGRSILYVKVIIPFIKFIFLMMTTYVLVSWSTWCVLRCVLYTQGLETGRWIFFIPGFLCCEIALSKASRASSRQSIVYIIPYIMAMGAFVVFSLNYEPIRTTFSWLIPFVGLESL